MRTGRIDRLVPCRIALIIVVVVVQTRTTAGNENELDQKLRQLVADLDSDQYSIRNRAQQQLRKIGGRAIPELAKVVHSKSPEQRYRARQIIFEIRRRALLEGFTALARQSEKEMDLDHGMWLIARILDHQSDRDRIERKLNEMVASVRHRLGKDVDASAAAPRKVVDAIIHVLKVDYGLIGNVEDYDNPENSSIERVLQSRKGLPILLSHAAISVAERMKIPLVGLPVPGRYMIKYNGSAAPKGQPKDDIIINPFGGWEILTPDQVKEIIPSFDPVRHLEPSSRRLALERMLRNLVSDFASARQPKKAAEANEYLLILQSVSAAELP